MARRRKGQVDIMMYISELEADYRPTLPDPNDIDLAYSIVDGAGPDWFSSDRDRDRVLPRLEELVSEGPSSTRKPSEYTEALAMIHHAWGWAPRDGWLYHAMLPDVVALRELLREERNSAFRILDWSTGSPFVSIQCDEFPYFSHMTRTEVVNAQGSLACIAAPATAGTTVLLGHVRAWVEEAASRPGCGLCGIFYGDGAA